MSKRILITFAVVVFSSRLLSAACVNKFLGRNDGPNRQVITLLTGKLTFQEAQELAKHSNVEWIDDKGKTVARQWGELKVVRPMPVGCDGKASGVVMIVTFPTSQAPHGTMTVKLDANTTVTLEEQKQ